MKFTIQNKLFTMSGLGLLFVCAVGATGYVAATRLTGAAGKIVDTGAALMTQMTADQDHDALRADVLAALLASANKDEAEQKSVRQELDEHSKELRESMKKLETSGLGADALESVRHTGPALLAYLASADEIVTLAATDHDAADAKLPAFLVAFKNLERDMGTMSEKIEQQARVTRDASEGISATAKATVVIAMAVCGAALLLLGWIISRGIVGPIRRAVQVAEQVARGDLRSHIRVSGSDETAQLLAALRTMNDNLARVVGSVREGSNNIADGTSHISAGNLDLSQRTELQASNLQQTAASMEEITATVRNNSETARAAAELAGTMSDSVSAERPLEAGSSQSRRVTRAPTRQANPTRRVTLQDERRPKRQAHALTRHGAVPQDRATPQDAVTHAPCTLRFGVRHRLHDRPPCVPSVSPLRYPLPYCPRPRSSPARPPSRRLTTNTRPPRRSPRRWPRPRASWPSRAS